MEIKVTLQVGVKILIQNDEGKYLLLKRSLVKYPEMNGCWDIVGGRIDPGTGLTENLAREIKEETGLVLTGTPKLIAAQDIIPNPERHIVRLTYVGKAEGEITLDGVEHDSYQWFSREELLNLENLDSYFKELLKNGSL